ncbi:MAG: family 20 glycosylhydrolase [Thermoanaerobaculia bacterium]
MTSPSESLLPWPQTVRTHADALHADRLRLAGDSPPRTLVRLAIDYLTDRGLLSPDQDASKRPSARPIRFVVHSELTPQAYELLINGDGALINAGDPRGFLYGAVTLRQWLAVHDWPSQAVSVPGVAIRDRPDFVHRGFLLDISRNKVPQMATLLRLVDQLIELKYNELQLYTEHTFAYPGHEIVWEGADPLTAGQIQQLDGYCKLRGIELVPNQNSFGHFHRWLAHEPYRQLAECPGGIEHPFSDRVEPFSLCPTDPGALALLSDLYAKLLPSFSSSRFHVGFDETFEIGRGRSREVCASQGLATVYLRFLEAVRNLASEHDRRILIWADMLLEHRDLLTDTPDDIVLCAWGYESGHPFREDGVVLSATGCEVYLCPGTSSWASFAGRGRNMLANLEEAAGAGVATSAAGYLLTDWGDRGHLQPLSVSYPALVAAAAFAWNGSDARRREPSSWADAVDRWVLDEPSGGLGAVTQTLADIYTVTGATQQNGTALFHLLMSPDDGLGHARYGGLSIAGLDQALEMLEWVTAAIAHATTHNPEGRHTRDELLWVADTLRLACDFGKTRLASPFDGLDGLPDDKRRELGRALGELADRRRELWLERNRPGGIEDSMRQFGKLGRRLDG